MIDPHANTKGYYINYPAEMTKAEVDEMMEFARQEGVPTNAVREPIPRPEYTIEWDPSLIPDASSNAGGQVDRSEQWATMDELLAPLDIVECYQRWCNKSPVAPKRGTGRQLWASCPFPHHPDRDPSCHISPEKGDNGGEWFCFPCYRGGDKYDLVAAALGYDLDAMHTKGDHTYYEVRRRMAEDLGWTEVEYDPKGNSLLRKRDPQEAPEEPPSEVADEELPPIDEPATATLDWQALIPDGTPLSEWMRATTVTEIPDEYLLWCGLAGVSCAAGRQVYIRDMPNIYSSLFVLLFGTSGRGKSRAVRILEDVIREAMPYDLEDPVCEGVLLAGSPGSGEAIPYAYARTLEDADGNKVVTTNVRALWNIEELSGLISRSGRAGSTIEDSLIELYDTKPRIIHRLAKSTLVGEQPFGSVVATTQPQAIKKFLTQHHVWSGFLNRWMPVLGTKKPSQIISRPWVDLDITTTAFRQLWEYYRTRAVAVTMNDEALYAWADFHERWIEPLKDDEETLSAGVFGRLDLLLRKLMLLFAINEKKTVIDLELLQRVLTMYPYIKHCYDSLTGRITMSEAEDCGDRMIKELRDHGGTMLRNDFLRTTNKWRTFSRNHKIRALEELLASGSIEEQIIPTTAKGGRPGKRYALPDSKLPHPQ